MKDFFNSLFWKISAVFLLILFIISAVYIYISVNTAEMYFQETRQKLDIKIASHISNEAEFFRNDSVNYDAMKNVFHNVMVINPSLEVYLLDTHGNILAFDADSNLVKLKKLPLEPIQKFISSKEEQFLLAPDPKNPGKEKPISAAKVFSNGKFKGYIYVILGGQEYENASQLLFGSYILRLGVRSMIIALLFATIIGFFAIGFIIRNLRKIVKVIRDFQNGNLKARIKLKSKGELQEFAQSFNEMADTIVDNIDEIKRMDNMRRDLVANVSHDLRTPLSVISGYLETILIKEDKLSPAERKQYLETILSSTGRLQSLVEELFELSKLEAKETKPVNESFSLAELLQDVHQKNLIIAQKKNIKIELSIDDNVPFVFADIRMMEKIFQNLLDNALKFTPSSGNVQIKLSKNNSDEIIAAISDNGPGIEAEQIPFIFDRYHQIKRVSTETSQGTGLGLTIVKKLVDLQGFKIMVESTILEETSFIITIPVKKLR
jgi:signal transduction histidine kinase